MSNDSVTVTSSKSWFSRVGSAIAGVLIGVILFIAAFPLLMWNEGRAITREKTLNEGQKIAVSIPAKPVDSANEGKLVHVTGEATPGSKVSDPTFEVTGSVLKLRRAVEMYQWTEDQKSETKQKLGGGEETVTTYSYKKDWSPAVIKSADFQKPDGHENPAEMRFESATYTADPITVGDFELSDSLIDMLGDFEPYPIGEAKKIVDEVNEPLHATTNGFFLGKDPSTPAIGDLKITFEAVAPGPVTIVARQVKDTFEPYTIAKMGEIELLKTGTLSAEGMFAAAQQENTIVTWLVRLGGFLMMFFGLILIANPLSVIGSVVPFIGDILSAGISLLAFVLALPLSLATIGVAWVAYRPLIGIPLLIVAVAAIFFGARMLPGRKPKVAPAAA